MSEPTPPFNPLPYYSPVIPINPRPLSVSVIAWFAIVIGGLGSLSPFCLIITHLLPQPPNPITDAMNNDAAWHAINLVLQIVGFFVCVGLLVGGIQSLNLKPLGRKLLIWYAYYNIFSLVVSMIVGPAILFPLLHKLVLQHPNDPAVMIGFWSGIGGWIFGLGFGIASIWVVLYFFNQPHVKAAFETLPPQIPLIPPPPGSSTSGAEFPPSNHNLPPR
jgi:hypothetical protein